MHFSVNSIGHVESPLEESADVPRQPDEGAPPAWMIFDERVAEALDGIAVGDHMVVLLWLDRAERDVLSVHPRGDRARPRQGVFSTRSPHRPNPIGLHDVEVIGIEGRRLQVRQLEAFDGTPILDLKPALNAHISAR